MSVTCVDERIAPRVHKMSFRVPGASVFPREDEPAYTLAAILFLSKISDIYSATRIVVADHGVLSQKGYFGCGMFKIGESVVELKRKLDQDTQLSFEEKNDYLQRVQLYDINRMGGIGRHAAWEVGKFRELEGQFNLKSLLGKILPNDEAREKIPNERLIFTQPYVSQRGLLANSDANGTLYNGNTIIHTYLGKPDIKNDYQITNELIMCSYLKGNTMREIQILEPTMNLLEQSPLRRLLQRIQQVLDYSLKRFSEEIAPIVNLSVKDCYDYLKTIKNNTNSCLYGSEAAQLERARKIAEEINNIGLLSGDIEIKYGLVNVKGSVLKLTSL